MVRQHDDTPPQSQHSRMSGIGLWSAFISHYSNLVPNLRCADAVSGHVQHVVNSPGNPVKPVRVATASISGEVIALYQMIALYRGESSRSV